MAEKFAKSFNEHEQDPYERDALMRQMRTGPVRREAAPGLAPSADPATPSDIVPTPNPADLSRVKDAAAQMTQPAQSAAPQYGRTVGQFANRLEGVNADKLGNAEHMTPKYQIMRTLSNFDQTQGLTPEVMAALNSLGLGDFTSNGKDKLMVGGKVDPRFEGFTTIDVIRNAAGGGDGWQYGAENPNAPQSVGMTPSPTGLMPGGMAPSASLGTGGGAMVPTDDSTFQKFLAMLQQQAGGPQQFERDALMRQMAR